MGLPSPVGLTAWPQTSALPMQAGISGQSAACEVPLPQNNFFDSDSIRNRTSKIFNDDTPPSSKQDEHHSGTVAHFSLLVQENL